MVERIRELLQARQLSPTQFADTIGVARPIISHILGGRNKPSLEVVQKIIAAFPDIALPWLLSGQGTMTAMQASADALAGPADASKPAAPLRDPVAIDPPRKRLVRATPGAAASEPTSYAASRNAPVAIEAVPGHGVEEQHPAQTGFAHLEATKSVDKEPPAKVVDKKSAADKAVSRIVVFYQDGTFAEYRPAEATW